MEAKIQRVPKPKSILKKADAKSKKAATDDDDDDEDAEEEESDIALSDLDDMGDSDREDLYVKTKLSINNGPALLASLKRIAIARDAGAVPFATHQTVVSAEPTAPKIEDISDDLNRELQLYAQSLEAAKRARALLRAEGVPFSRPKDYFAEMVKDDGHMEKVKAKLIEAATNKKAAAEARKLRDLKKFGKQVQVAKLQERHKEKRETLEKIKALKKSTLQMPPTPFSLPPHLQQVSSPTQQHILSKPSTHLLTRNPRITERSENGNDLTTNEADLFDVGVDDELNKHGKRGRGGDQGGRTPNHKRAKKDAKYGFGGRKKHSKSGDAISSGDLSGFNARKMKSQGSGGGGGFGAGAGGKKKFVKAARPGKNKRAAKR